MPDNYPLPSFHFRVDFLFPNESLADQECRFAKVSGIETKLETQAYNELGNLYNKLMLPTSRSYENLVLERGIVISSRVYKWFQQSYYDLQVEPIPILICLLGEDHKPIISWLFYDAFPINWKYSPLDALKSEYLVETITLGYSNYVELMNSQGQDASAFINAVKSKIST
jgi:phage tail-like protein